jgi:hypothetical protein
MDTHAPLYTHVVCQPLTGHVIRQKSGPALGRKLRLTRRRARPRDKTPPCPSGRARPRLPAPPRIHEGPLLRTVARVIESQDGLGRDIGRTSFSPEPSSALNIYDGGRPNVIGYSEADASLNKFFPILSIVSTTAIWATPPKGSGTQPSPQPRPRLSAGNKQSQVNNKVQRPCCLQDAKTSSTARTQPPSTRMCSPYAYK